MRSVGVVALCAVSLFVGVADVAADTRVGVTVLTGTTIDPPGVIDLGAGAPGTTLVATGIRVAWLSNDTGMDVTVAASGLGRQDGAAEDATSAMDAAMLRLVTPDGTLALDAPRAIGRIAWLTGSAPESVRLSLELVVPDVQPGTYQGVLTFAVVDPDDTAAGPRVARTRSGDATIAAPVEVTVQ